jgi:hypothetical protein
VHSAMAASASTYGSSPFLPHARGGGQTSFRGVGHALGGGGGVSTQSQPAPDSVGLTKAMSKVMLQDSYSRHGAGMSNGAGLAAMDASQPQGGGGSGDGMQGATQQPLQSAGSQGFRIAQPHFTQSQAGPSSQLPASFQHTLPRRLALDLSQGQSQELPLWCVISSCVASLQ